MMRAMRGLLIVATSLVGAACGASRVDPGTGPRGPSDLITFEEMRQRGQFSNLYDLVRELRPRWVRPQGPDTFMGAQGEVQVHMDGNHLGGVGVLRNLAAVGVTSIRWISPIEAPARYGLNHSHGAIVVSTGPAH
jgi:hypothetical protein